MKSNKDIVRNSFYGYRNSTLENVMNQLTENDLFVSPRAEPHNKKNRLLTKEAQKAGEIVMNFVGASSKDNKFSNNDNVPSKKFAKNSIQEFIIAGKLKYTKADFDACRNSVKVFYDKSINPKQVEDSLDARNVTKQNIDHSGFTDIGGREVITSSVRIFNNNRYEIIDKLVPATVVRVSGPDLNKQEAIYQKAINTKTLNQRYEDEMLARTKLWIEAADQSGCNFLIINAIGGGAFSNGYNCSEVIARCFAKNLDGKKFKNITGIIFSLPNDSDYYSYSNAFSNLKLLGLSVDVTNAEMTNIAIAIDKNIPGASIGYTIAGHPTRPIGNGWKVEDNGHGAQAQEESAAKHFLDYILSQDVYLNKTNIMSPKSYIPIDVGNIGLQTDQLSQQLNQKLTIGVQQVEKQSPLSKFKEIWNKYAVKKSLPEIISDKHNDQYKSVMLKFNGKASLASQELFKKFKVHADKDQNKAKHAMTQDTELAFSDYYNYEPVIQGICKELGE